MIARQPGRFSGPALRGLKIGLLGGSFNPAHDGHRHISLWALKTLGLDQVWWLVSPQNPLKPAAGMAAQAERLASAVRVARHPRIVATVIENQLGARYTADTLAALTARFPGVRFVWLMGADNLAQIGRWRNWRRIFETVPIAVFRRPGYGMPALGGMAAQRYARRRAGPQRAKSLAGLKPPAWIFMTNPLHPASSTAIRRASAGGSQL